VSERLERLLEGRLGRRALTLVEQARAVPILLAFELAVRRFLADGMVDRAASLAYYGLLSLLPSLMIGASTVSLVGGADTADDISTYVREQGASTSLASTVQGIVETAISSAPEEASTIGLIGLATLIYGASRGFAAAGRALDLIWRREPQGLTIVRRVAGIGWTLVLLVLGLVATVLTFVGRGLAEDILDWVGLDEVSTVLWTAVRWPLAAIAVMLSMQLVMWAAPSGPRGRFRLVTPGAVVAASVWLGASAGYGIYVGEISSYNATYGAFAALVILLLWIWLTSNAFLFGCEFDAVLWERREGRSLGPPPAIYGLPTPAASTPPAAGPAPPPRERAAPRDGRSRAEDR
jgi:membrane protein